MIPLQTASGHPVTHILFSPDGSAVAVAQPHYGVTLLERATGRTLAVCALPRRAALTGLTFCGGGQFLAAASAKALEVFDANTGAPVATALGYNYKGLKLAERDGSVVGLGGGHPRVVWNPDTKTNVGITWRPLSGRWSGVIAALRALAGRPASLDVPSPDGRFAIGINHSRVGRRAALFDLDAGRLTAEIDATAADAPPTARVAKFGPDGTRFAINDGRTLDVYATEPDDHDEDEQPTANPLVQRANRTRAATAPMPHTVLTPHFTLRSEKHEEGWYPPFALAADGRGLLVKRPRNRIQWWDVPTGALVNEWSWRFEWVTCVASSADGLTAVAGGRFGRVLLWDLE